MSAPRQCLACFASRIFRQLVWQAGFRRADIFVGIAQRSIVARIAILATRICLVMFAASTGVIADRRGIDRAIADCLTRAAEWSVDVERVLG